MEGIVSNRLLNALDPAVPVLLSSSREASSSKCYLKFLLKVNNLIQFVECTKKIYTFALAHSYNCCLYLCPHFVCLWVLLFVFVFVDTNSPIIFMVALDNSAIVVRFAALDNLSHIAVDLKHPLLSLKGMSLRLGILGK